VIREGKKMAREDEIRLIAYQIWEKEGRKNGRDYDNWLKAEAIWEKKQPLLALSRGPQEVLKLNTKPTKENLLLK
jgi:hypothetical protein